jgi:integrase
VLYTHNQKSIKISTGEKIRPEFWDENACRARKSYKGFTNLNAAIERTEADIKGISNLAKSLGTDPTTEYVRQQLDKKRARQTKPFSFFELFEEWMRVSKGKKTESTLGVHKDCLRLLRLFSQTKGVALVLDKIDLNVYHALVDWLNYEAPNARTKEQGLSTNTVGKHIRTLKAFMNWCVDKEITANKIVQHKEFKDFNIETHVVYLRQEELKRMIEHDFSYDKKLDLVRDIFVFETATGLRYSDIKKLRPENFKGDHILITTVKTRDQTKIPLTSFARQVLQKYGGSLPKPYGFKRMSDLLKVVAEKCGIDEKEHVVTYKGSQRIEKTVPKYSILTPHCARRTFICQGLERGLRPEVIMKVTGHKEYETMRRYIRITEDTVEREVNKAWSDAPALLKVV